MLFRYAPGRGGVHAEGFLEGFRGRFLQCDGYDGYECLTGVDRPEGPWTLVHCWSHLRRRFVKQMRNTRSPIAEAAVRQIATLYAIEASVRGMPPAARLAARQAQSAPIVAALKTWFEKQLSMISSGSTLAADIRHARAPGLADESATTPRRAPPPATPSGGGGDDNAAEELMRRRRSWTWRRRRDDDAMELKWRTPPSRRQRGGLHPAHRQSRRRRRRHQKPTSEVSQSR